MATSREYAYYIKGNKVAIVQKDWTFAGGQTIGQPGLNDLGAYGALLWKSPKETITDGIEMEYVYTPFYNFQGTSSFDLVASVAAGTTSNDKWLYGGVSGSEYYLAFQHTGVNSTSSFVVDDYIVIRNNPYFNGAHKVISSTFSTNTYVIFNTKLKKFGLAGAYLGDASADYRQEKHLGTIYSAVTAMEDESFDLDLTRYQANAIVYYLKAKFAEDAGNLEMKEYFMREFRRMVEKDQSGKKVGTYIAQGFNILR